MNTLKYLIISIFTIISFHVYPLHSQNVAAIISKYVEATGGERKWKELRTLQIKGTHVIERDLLNANAGELERDFDHKIMHRIGFLHEERFRNTRTLRLITPQGVWQAVGGQSVRRINDGLPVRASLYDLHGEFVNYQQKGYHFELKKRKSTIEGEKCYVIKGRVDNTETLYYISEESYMLVQTKRTIVQKRSRRKEWTTISYKDFRNVQGYVFPFRQDYEYTQAGISKNSYYITAIHPNTPYISVDDFTPEALEESVKATQIDSKIEK